MPESRLPLRGRSAAGDQYVDPVLKALGDAMADAVPVGAAFRPGKHHRKYAEAQHSVVEARRAATRDPGRKVR